MWDISSRDLAGYPFGEHYPVETDLLSRHFLWKSWTSLTFQPTMYLFFIKKFWPVPYFHQITNKPAGFRSWQCYYLSWSIMWKLVQLSTTSRKDWTPSTRMRRLHQLDNDGKDFRFILLALFGLEVIIPSAWFVMNSSHVTNLEWKKSIIMHFTEIKAIEIIHLLQSDGVSILRLWVVKISVEWWSIRGLVE